MRKLTPKELGFIPTTGEIETARAVWENTKNLTVKEVLMPFAVECPGCGAGYEARHIVPPIRGAYPGAKYHLVMYKCSCGAVFKKMEGVRGK